MQIWAADALYEEAESGYPKNLPIVHIDPEAPDQTPQTARPHRPDVQLNTVAVRLGNNKLKDLAGLRKFLDHVMDSPDELTWLDLSCNQLEGIDDVLCHFPNLQVRFFRLSLHL